MEAGKNSQPQYVPLLWANPSKSTKKFILEKYTEVKEEQYNVTNMQQKLKLHEEASRRENTE